MKRGKTNAKRKPLAVVVEPVVLRKATCSACRAFDCTMGASGGCTLGYAVEALRRKCDGFGTFTLKRPAEPCPRPLTYAKFFSCKHRSYTENPSRQPPAPGRG